MPSDAHVLVAPDSFKGTFSATEVARAVAEGLRAGGREALELPLGDGGEGTMEVLGGTVHEATVSDPLGRPVRARYAVRDDGTAVVEAAQASGLSLGNFAPTPDAVITSFMAKVSLFIFGGRPGASRHSQTRRL